MSRSKRWSIAKRPEIHGFQRMKEARDQKRENGGCDCNRHASTQSREHQKDFKEKRREKGESAGVWPALSWLRGLVVIGDCPKGLSSAIGLR